VPGVHVQRTDRGVGGDQLGAPITRTGTGEKVLSGRAPRYVSIGGAARACRHDLTGSGHDDRHAAEVWRPLVVMGAEALHP
jgi:hypothetical protein